ncbi:tyrosine-type recombinase/integrase [Halobacillus sp. GSS1]|uniref:tyrosine-type recombinase/integrase n=1 Tax=Halobacillus sp. GSS1 TaxID=2815919 RepID=UPI001A8D0149|nr:tyrosine-type recombinase/integrase [Halobacillus sp. GSS1]MBN9653625.1 tyrosine-type recombinase/integrase [Halobacillus sp. GSS1]
MDNFMLYCSSKNLSQKTLRSYDQTLRLFIFYLDDQFQITEVSKVKSAHIRHYIKYLRERGKYTVVSSVISKKVNHPDHRNDFNKPLSDTTVANYLRNIKVFFNYLYSIEHEIKVNPVESIKNIKPQRKQKTLLKTEEIVNVLKQFDVTTFHGYRNWIVTRLLLDTGLRISECLYLRHDQIDFKNKAILVTNSKNKQERYVYFSYRMSTDLKRWLQYHDRFSSSEYVFPTIRGTVLEIRNFEKSLRDAGRRVNVSIHPHQLRNNFAKYYLLNGGDWVTLSRILGHSSVEVTQKAYLDFTDAEISKKYQKHSPLSNLKV